jgi:hypothetical protein
VRCDFRRGCNERVHRGRVMTEISLYNPVRHSTQLLRGILYCEFDPHLGPRPVFQSPANFVSNEVLDCLSDHLIASSELCGHSIAVSAFGLRFMGFPQHIRDDKYARNQFMFNVCFVFDDQSSNEAVSAYRPLVQQLNQELRHLETMRNFLTDPSTRESVARVIEGVLTDINHRGQLVMPPTGFYGLPNLKPSSQPLFLQEVFPRASPAEVLPHEVPVIVARQALEHGPAAGSDCEGGELLPKLLAQLDGRRTIAGIAAQLSIPLPLAVEKIRALMYDGVVLTIDAITMVNVYLPTSLLRDLPADQASRDKCLDFCRGSPSAPRPDFNQAYRVLCSMEHGKRLAEVCAEVGLGEQDNIDVVRLVTFARVYRYLRRLHHYPLWAYRESGGAGGVSRVSGGREADLKVLAECNGRQCYDSIAVKLGISVQEVAPYWLSPHHHQFTAGAFNADHLRLLLTPCATGHLPPCRVSRCLASVSLTWAPTGCECLRAGGLQGRSHRHRAHVACRIISRKSVTFARLVETMLLRDTRQLFAVTCPSLGHDVPRGISPLWLLSF